MCFYPLKRKPRPKTTTTGRDIFEQTAIHVFQLRSFFATTDYADDTDKRKEGERKNELPFTHSIYHIRVICTAIVQIHRVLRRFFSGLLRNAFMGAQLS